MIGSALVRVRRGVGCAVLGWALVAAGPWGAAATRTRPVAAFSAWEQAVRGREALEGQAAGTRTKAGYERVLDGFRAIYHENPRDGHAAEAVFAVAEVLAEEGRWLAGQEGAASGVEAFKCLKAAVGQYEFLREQYPGSSLRTAALLAEGQIEAKDLGDARAGRERFLGVVRESPRSEAAKAARAELVGLKGGLRRSEVPTHRGEAAMNGAREGLGVDEGKNVPQGLKPGSGEAGGGTAEALPIGKTKTVQAGAGKGLALVTGIRHWSTPTYTRVAIDLGDEVTFEAARVPHPDRIYFDLHGARLGAELVGKSFDVTDDGFLKKIRAAQAGGDVTRVVLDVNDVTEYSAFLLPNPYRLIIDIHGGKAVANAVKEPVTDLPVPAAAVRQASAAANASGLPAMAPTDGGEMVRPVGGVGSAGKMASEKLHDNSGSAFVIMGHPRTTKPVPNAVAKPGTVGEVAAVSEVPGRVEAMKAPTSKPIAAVVKPVNLGSDTGKSGRASLDSHPSTTTSLPLAAGPGKAAEKTADGQTSLVRALGLKVGRIVIDAGHGGHDSGTLGVDGIEEKDVVLDVALRLGKLLHERLGAEIVYTRSDDTFIPLETRTAIANKAQADLFLSIHANSSQDDSARGVETYYLNFTSDTAALEVAARENAVGGQSVHQLSDLVKKIALKDKIAESREFAADVEGSLYAGLEKGNTGLKNRGVKKAPFVVLIGANMPSVLAEISFVTNAKDAAQLREPEYRERVAESLYAGVAKYEGGLAGARPVGVKRAALQ